jgi:hypothetical protein
MVTMAFICIIRRSAVPNLTLSQSRCRSPTLSNFPTASISLDHPSTGGHYLVNKWHCHATQLHTSDSTLQAAHCRQHTADSTLQAAQCRQHTVSITRTMNITKCRSRHWRPHISYYFTALSVMHWANWYTGNIKAPVNNGICSRHFD